MFDISFFEIMIIAIVALIVIGPERLPQVARTLGHLIGRCRQLVYSIKTDIHNELRMEELKNMHNTMQETMHSIESTVREEINEIKSATQLDPRTDTPNTSAGNTRQLADSSEKSADSGTAQPKSPDNEQPPSR
ncbi:MAG: Sec-independent protein translocase protein TatB [Nitrosomonas sp.]|nr:Sec-independent protein translocase protein TatB [Nitrosomonas sp.]MCW5608365.1 Sec-independent protein translocase protein TatB [Nitrosomonas sp.]